MIIMHPTKLKARLLLEMDGQSFLARQRVALLEAIGIHGSISAAARAVGLSYKTAWDTVDALNNLSDKPLVLRATGGRQGGGSTLTAQGRATLQMFQEGEKRLQSILDGLTMNHMDLDDLQSLTSRFSMRTSARNQFAGRVEKITLDAVNAELRIRLDEENVIVSVITVESVSNLELRHGSEVYALIKSSSVILSSGPATFSAENLLCGTVASLRKGSIYAEITLQLAFGKTVTAVLTSDTLKKLGLKRGAQACAIFPGSAVILARP